MTNPKVSVVTPLYNTPKKDLKVTIDSILSQTFKDFEYLILNDSPNNTGLDKLVKSYNDPRIKYFKNETNLGLEESTNKLVKKSRGEYIAIADHDDISLPTRLEKEVKHLDENSKVGLVSAQFTVFGVQNWTSQNPLSDSAIKKRLETASCISHTTCMIRKSVLIENKIKYEKEFFPAASYRVLTRLALVTQVHNLPDVLVRYRMDGENTSIKHAEKRRIAREKIRSDYTETSKINKIKKKFKFETVKLLKGFEYSDDRRYYKVQKNGKNYFVKSDSNSFEHEFIMAKKMFDMNNKHFIKPIEFSNGKTNYIIMDWCDSVGLDKLYIKNKKELQQSSNSFAKQLADIYQLLYRAKIVHRDIIPRNFLIKPDGTLILIDFYYAVEYDNYFEYDHIKNDMTKILTLGMKFALGSFRWDDAYSFTRIAEYVLGKDFTKNNEDIKKITSDIGNRVIVASMEDVINSIYQKGGVIGGKNTEISKREHIINLKEAHIQAREKEIEALKNSRTYKLGRIFSAPFRLAKRTIKK